MKQWMCIFILGAAMFSGIFCSGETPEAGYDYILWTGGRYSRTAEDTDRDARWFKDLGFTHAFIGQTSAAGEDSGRHTEIWKNFFQSFQRQGLKSGLRIFFPENSVVAGKMGVPVSEMIQQGMLTVTDDKPRKGSCTQNPVHPEIIRFYAKSMDELVSTVHTNDPGKTLSLFLIGTEMGWYVPKKDKELNPAAKKIILAKAHEAGIETKNAGNFEEILKSDWWKGVHGHGRDWELRKAMEDAVLKQIPDAQFMIDPEWAIKLVHGFGADWTYIADDPRNVAVQTTRLKAITDPALACVGVQLTRLSHGGRVPHDALMEAGLLALCLGADKLYHWGIQNFEPGREQNLFYGLKSGKSPEGFPEFTESQIKDIPAVLQCLYQNRSKSPFQQLWKCLDKNTQSRIEEAVALGGKSDFDDLDLGGDIPKIALKKKPEKKAKPSGQFQAVITGLNRVLASPSLYDKNEFADFHFPKRAAKLLSVQEQGKLTDRQLKELNRLLIEAMFSRDALKKGVSKTSLYILDPSPSPSICELEEDYRTDRSDMEPAIRSLGRLIRERGTLFAAMKPLQPELLVVSGIYGSFNQSLCQGLLSAHLPYRIAYQDASRKTRIPTSPLIAILKTEISNEEYDLLAKATENGGKVFVPAGFKVPEGKAPIPGLVEWNYPDSKVDSGKKPHEAREMIHGWAAELRKFFHQAGFKPLFDSENPDVIMKGYEYKGTPVLFAVNDKRTYGIRPEGWVMEDKGLPNPVEFLIRDPAENLTVINIDTGTKMPLEKTKDGWKFQDTLEPAWYRLYAVLKDNKTWQGPGPLPLPPAIKDLTAEWTENRGVELKWKVDVPDWVGCDVQSYRISRNHNGEKEETVTEIYAHPLSGPGGLVETWIDPQGKKGDSYTFEVVSPLLVKGPASRAQVKN